MQNQRVLIGTAASSGMRLQLLFHVHSRNEKQEAREMRIERTNQVNAVLWQQSLDHLKPADTAIPAQAGAYEHWRTSSTC